MEIVKELALTIKETVNPYIILLILLVILIIKYSDAITTAIKLFKLQFNHKQKALIYTSTLKAIASVGNSMQRLKEITEIDRVVLIELINGGNTPKVGSIMHARVIDVKVNSDTGGKEEDYLYNVYNNVRVDNQYIKMCLEAATNGMVKLIWQEMPPQMLKNWYAVEEIKYSEVYHIYSDVNTESMFILSVATRNEKERFSDVSVRTRIAIEIDNIIDNFTKFR